ncbi:hypothetical protein WDA79_09420 [Streptomyces sp. A475]|uniref:hypothetical protein n=1 Tax=Streptomyces sp. A475 TaxID=3131976 RepID=UPI0030C9A60A
MAKVAGSRGGAGVGSNPVQKPAIFGLRTLLTSPVRHGLPVGLAPVLPSISGAARVVGPGSYELTGSSAWSRAARPGTLLKIDADGLFQIERRGPNLCIRAFGELPFDAESLESLTSTFVPWVAGWRRLPTGGSSW